MHRRWNVVESTIPDAEVGLKGIDGDTWIYGYWNEMTQSVTQNQSWHQSGRQKLQTAKVHVFIHWTSLPHKINHQRKWALTHFPLLAAAWLGSFLSPRSQDTWTAGSVPVWEKSSVKTMNLIEEEIPTFHYWSVAQRSQATWILSLLLLLASYATSGKLLRTPCLSFPWGLWGGGQMLFTYCFGQCLLCSDWCVCVCGINLSCYRQHRAAKRSYMDSLKWHLSAHQGKPHIKKDKD